jgi:acetolactate synthase-1/2/3 large subunit
VGSGCSGITSVVLELANLLQARIVTSADGKGLISAFHPQFLGVFGFAGHSSAAEALKDPNVELVIAIGTNFSEWASGGWDEQALMNDRLIHIDSVEKHFDYSPLAKMHIIGSIANICMWLSKKLQENGTRHNPEKITNALKSLNSFLCTDPAERDTLLPKCIVHQEPEKYEDRSTPIKPQKLMYELGTRFPPSTRFLADTGNSCAWSIHYLHPIDRRMDNDKDDKNLNAEGRKHIANGAESSTFRVCVDFASMGWAIGASIGTALACRESKERKELEDGKKREDWPIVCITGDGSVLMSGQEITVALMEKLTVIYVILNDHALGMVKHGQSLSGEEAIAYQLPLVNFQKMAESMGISAFTIKSPKDFLKLDIEAICRKKGPTLLDVHIDIDEIPPIGMRINSLETATKSNQGKENE